MSSHHFYQCRSPSVIEHNEEIQGGGNLLLVMSQGIQGLLCDKAELIPLLGFSLMHRLPSGNPFVSTLRDAANSHNYHFHRNI
ncbi:hypothetical protein CgunFtcFv8_010271 [Champsocephalus gunnari]|uniref:Uncharacterized protein n=1 Tax=Champsocephalus gunnari TaxID=52237 RepID=A0AAN8DUV4_CHAGU|nr:hypothetical protein CgunFtcFv8_010271 [Champsocephalus gunnari]